MNKSDLMHNIQSACTVGLQLIPPTILCDSIGLLGLKQPATVREEALLSECISMMQAKHIGSVLVVGGDGALKGIFTERDCLMKIMGKVPDLAGLQVKDFMTPEPICERRSGLET